MSFIIFRTLHSSQPNILQSTVPETMDEVSSTIVASGSKGKTLSKLGSVLNSIILPTSVVQMKTHWK